LLLAAPLIYSHLQHSTQHLVGLNFPSQRLYFAFPKNLGRFSNR
jgi:hypothetical protein